MTRLLAISCTFESYWSPYLLTKTQKTDIVLGKLKRQEIFNICQREMPRERKQVIKAAQMNRDKSTFVIKFQQQ